MDSDPKERLELLPAKKTNVPKVAENGVGSKLTVAAEEVVQKSTEPPDGGIRAYSVVLAAFVSNGLIFGIINSYSVMYTVLLARLKADNVDSADIKASLVGVLTVGTTFLLSSVSGVLAGLLGLRTTAVAGGCIASAGLMLSSFEVQNVYALCLTYGVIFGLGASLCYTPSLAILGHYFKKRLGLVNGIVTIGSSVLTVFMPPFMDYLIKHYSLEWMLRVLSLLTSGLIVCALLFKPLSPKAKRENQTYKQMFKKMACISLWRKKRYRMWALSLPVALFGYFVPYVHIKKFIDDQKFESTNLNLPLQCLAITSAIGRLAFGALADKNWIDIILLQQISFYVIGTLTIILGFARNFALIVVIALGMGLFDGGFIALLGPVAFKLVGSEQAAEGIGCMLGLAAFPLSIGPPIAGAIYEMKGDYTLAFILAGISPLIGATLMFAIRLFKEEDDQTNNNQTSSNQTNNNQTSSNPTNNNQTRNTNGQAVSLTAKNAERAPEVQPKRQGLV